MSTRLPPILRRAAPEILQCMYAEGSRSVREWTERNFGSMKNTEMWVDLWNMALQIDHAVADFTNDPDLLAFLGTSDTAEIILRRLASFKYRQRTGDKVGAQQMLAVHAPGSSAEIAPSWMVQEAPLYSKVEWQRADRVSKSGRGRGRVC